MLKVVGKVHHESAEIEGSTLSFLLLLCQRPFLLLLPLRQFLLFHLSSTQGFRILENIESYEPYFALPVGLLTEGIVFEVNCQFA